MVVYDYLVRVGGLGRPLENMGDFVPGVLGRDPLTETDDVRDPGESPGSGWTDLGPVGMDSGGNAPTAVSVQISGWPRSISWDEFSELAARPPRETEDAQIHSEAVPDPQLDVVREGRMFRVGSFTVEIQTVQEDNWVVTSQKSDDLLSHEQGHYNLTGLSGRDMGNEIAAVRARTPAALQARVSQIIRTYRRRAKAWTDSYDTETDHSRNRQAQSRWDQRIRDAMRNGTAFSPP